MEPSGEDLEKIILDYAARIGSFAKVEGVASSQLEQIIASLENSKDRRYALLYCAAFAKRQASRLGRGNRMAYEIVEAMKELYEKNLGKEEARKLLGLTKWVRESLEDVRVPFQGVKDYQEYLNLIIGSKR